jgi:preprotein translocase subunit SecG
VIYLLFLLYLILCILVGIIGRRTRIGFWGTTFIALLFTPFIVFICLMLLQPRNGATADS